MADPGPPSERPATCWGGLAVGAAHRLPTVVDAALGVERMYVSAGRRGWDVALAPADLVRLTGAVTAEIQA